MAIFTRWKPKDPALVIEQPPVTYAMTERERLTRLYGRWSVIGQVVMFNGCAKCEQARVRLHADHCPVYACRRSRHCGHMQVVAFEWSLRRPLRRPQGESA